MKYINKLTLALVVLCMGLLTACNQDQEGAIYQPNNAELSFNSSALEDVAVPAGNPVYNLEVFRGNVNATPQGKPSFSVTVKQNGQNVELEGCTISDYQFEEGASRGYVAINVSPLAVGVNANVTVKIDDADLSAGGVQTTSFSICKEYDWVSLGMGTFTDYFTIGDVTYNVEIQKAEGFDRWRVIDPYAESIKNDDGDNGDWLDTAACPYIEFWNIGDGLVSFNPYYIGLLYQGDPSAKIYAYPATALGLTNISGWADEKTVLLAPYYYVPALGGGFNYATQYTARITLP